MSSLLSIWRTSGGSFLAFVSIISFFNFVSCGHQLDFPLSPSKSLLGKAIFGQDDREVLVGEKESLAHSVAIMVASRHLAPIPEDDRFYQVLAPSLQEKRIPWEEGWGRYCSDGPYAQELALGVCHGVLIAPDLVATVGHCLDNKRFTLQESCHYFLWVFDVIGSGHRIEKKHVYKCQEVLDWETREIGHRDYALIKLDREVQGRRPLEVEWDLESWPGDGESRGPGKDGEVPISIFSIAGPLGVPLKTLNGGTIQATVKEGEGSYFITDLDASPGTSGAPVFHAQTNRVLGLLARGLEWDWEFDGQRQCFRERICQEDGECEGIHVQSMDFLLSINGVSLTY